MVAEAQTKVRDSETAAKTPVGAVADSASATGGAGGGSSSSEPGPDKGTNAAITEMSLPYAELDAPRISGSLQEHLRGQLERAGAGEHGASASSERAEPGVDGLPEALTGASIPIDPAWIPYPPVEWRATADAVVARMAVSHRDCERALSGGAMAGEPAMGPSSTIEQFKGDGNSTEGTAMDGGSGVASRASATGRWSLPDVGSEDSVALAAGLAVSESVLGIVRDAHKR